MDNKIEIFQRCSISNDSKLLEKTLAEIDDMIKTYDNETQINDDFDPIQEERVEDKYDTTLDDMHKNLIKGDNTNFFGIYNSFKLIDDNIDVCPINRIIETCSFSNVNRVIEDKNLEETIHAKINDLIKPYGKGIEIYDDFNSIQKENILENKIETKLGYKQNYLTDEEYSKSIESSTDFKLMQRERFDLTEKAKSESFITNDHENVILNDKITVKLEQKQKIPDCNDCDNENDKIKSFKFISNSKNKFKDENLEETINDKINDLQKLTIKEEIENKGENENIEKDSLKNNKNNSCGFNYIVRNIIKFYRRIFKNKK